MKVTIDREKAALQIAEMLDAIYMSGRDAQDYTIRIGIWDDAESPYSIYATLHRDSDNMLQVGESTYGSETLEEAIDKLCTEVGDFFAELNA